MAKITDEEKEQIENEIAVERKYKQHCLRTIAQRMKGLKPFEKAIQDDIYGFSGLLINELWDSGRPFEHLEAAVEASSKQPRFKDLNGPGAFGYILTVFKNSKDLGNKTL